MSTCSMAAQSGHWVAQANGCLKGGWATQWRLWAAIGVFGVWTCPTSIQPLYWILDGLLFLLYWTTKTETKVRNSSWGAKPVARLMLAQGFRTNPTVSYMKLRLAPVGHPLGGSPGVRASGWDLKTPRTTRVVLARKKWGWKKQNFCFYFLWAVLIEFLGWNIVCRL
jgi:hypothetical protein